MEYGTIRNVITDYKQGRESVARRRKQKKERKKEGKKNEKINRELFRQRTRRHSLGSALQRLFGPQD